MSPSQSQETLKAQFVSSGGIWGQAWDTILKTDPVYFASYLRIRSVPINNRKLDRKLQELVLLAVSASCTTVYRPGIKAHTQGAIAAGASDAEILETLELCSVLGIHAITFAVPVLLETLQEQGRAIEKPAVWDQRQQKLKDEFIAKRGFYTEIWDDILSVDADYFAAYTDFSSVTTVNGRGALSPKAKELLLCAIDCSPTHMVYLGLKAHMRQALNLGATPEELMGVHTVLEGAQALVDAHKGAHNSSVL